MTTSTIQSTFDIAALISAVERRDAAGQLELYTADAEVTTVDESARPSQPRVLHGHAEIEPFLQDVCGREMTHRVSQAFASGDHLAWEVECAYPDGKRVLCQAIAVLRDGRIASQRGVQAWDV
jgi:ketosteroid isomerase-like protein